MDALMEAIAARVKEMPGLEIPPRAFVAMGGEMQDYTPGVCLTVRFPVKPEYRNPFGFMQGGFILAAVDNTIGPLSMLVAEPSVTTHLNSTFIRPVGPEESHITIVARLVEKTRKVLHMEAEVNNGNGKCCVRCVATFAIVES